MSARAGRGPPHNKRQLKPRHGVHRPPSPSAAPHCLPFSPKSSRPAPSSRRGLRHRLAWSGRRCLGQRRAALPPPAAAGRALPLAPARCRPRGPAPFSLLVFTSCAAQQFHIDVCAVRNSHRGRIKGGGAPVATAKRSPLLSAPHKKELTLTRGRALGGGAQAPCIRTGRRGDHRISGAEGPNIRMGKKGASGAQTARTAPAGACAPRRPARPPRRAVPPPSGRHGCLGGRCRRLGGRGRERRRCGWRSHPPANMAA